MILYHDGDFIILFYLNYVGCKGWIIRMKKRLLFMFYLNYVGCKEKLKVEKQSKLLCFTLTMWDVKGNFDEIIYGVDFVLP